MGYLSTTSAAAVLGVQHYQLAYMIRTRRIPRPARDDSGDYCWTDADIERARAVIASRGRPAQTEAPRCA